MHTNQDERLALQRWIPAGALPMVAVSPHPSEASASEPTKSRSELCGQARAATIWATTGYAYLVKKPAL